MRVRDIVVRKRLEKDLEGRARRIEKYGTTAFRKSSLDRGLNVWEIVSIWVRESSFGAENTIETPTSSVGAR